MKNPKKSKIKIMTRSSRRTCAIITAVLDRLIVIL